MENQGGAHTIVLDYSTEHPDSGVTSGVFHAKLLLKPLPRSRENLPGSLHTLPTLQRDHSCCRVLGSLHEALRDASDAADPRRLLLHHRRPHRRAIHLRDDAKLAHYLCTLANETGKSHQVPMNKKF